MKINRYVFISCVAILMAVSGLQAKGAGGLGATKADVSYSDDFERCTLDFYKAKSDKPTPLIIFFHGGGFRGGDKNKIGRHPLFGAFRNKGVSFVSCNYPLLGKQVGAKDYLKIMSSCLKAVEYIKSQYKDWNVDPEKVSLSGGSAGALIIEYLAYKEKFKCQSLFAIQQPRGTDYFTTPHMFKGAPPIILWTTSPSGIHDPSYARKVADKAKELSIECEIYGKQGTKLPELPNNTPLHDVAMDFLKKSWGGGESTVGQKKDIEGRQLLYVPETYYDDSNKKWPLVIFLHGMGERGDDLNKVLKNGPPRLINDGKQFPFFVLSPQCFPKTYWSHEKNISLIMKNLETIKKKYRIDSKRIYLTGLSLGGFGTYTLASKYPNTFAAIAPICGGVVDEKVDTVAAKIAHIPTWVFHGDADTTVKYSYSEKIVAALKKNGSTVKLTTYKGVGHDAWTRTYKDPQLYEWFLQHKLK